MTAHTGFLLFARKLATGFVVDKEAPASDETSIS
jgi:hypothetical protein